MRIRRIEAPVSTLTKIAVCLAERVDCPLGQFLPVVGFSGVELPTFFNLLRKKCDQALSDDVLTVLDSMLNDGSDHSKLVQPAVKALMERGDLGVDQAIRIAHHFLDVANFGDNERTGNVKEWLKNKLLTLSWESLFTYVKDRSPHSKVREILIDVFATRVSELTTEEILAINNSSDSCLKKVVRPYLESRVHDLQHIVAG